MLVQLSFLSLDKKCKCALFRRSSIMYGVVAPYPKKNLVGPSSHAPLDRKSEFLLMLIAISFTALN